MARARSEAPPRARSEAPPRARRVDGRHAGGRDRLEGKGFAGLQRSRVLAAAVTVVAGRGYPDASVAAICARAGVSRRTFYELFENREECVAAILGDLERRLKREIAVALTGEVRWRERVRLGLWTILCLLDREPALARVCLVECQRAGRLVLAERARLLARLERTVDEGRAQSARASEAGTLAAEAVVGAIVTVLQARLAAADAGGPPLRDLLGELMALIVLPYLGVTAARRERMLGESVVYTKQTVEPAIVGGEALLAQLPIRLTYRTAKVLESVALEPGASNRHIGERAGVQDQGQVSKLLRRLELHGLLENGASSAHSKGEANAWRLTAAGEQVARTLGLRRWHHNKRTHREGSCS